MASNNRVIAALYAVVGLALFAIAYSGGGTESRVAYALRILLATLTVIVAGHALLRRDVPLLLVAAGLAAWSVDTFSPQRILVYIGIALFLGGFFLMRKHRMTTPRDTGG